MLFENQVFLGLFFNDPEADASGSESTINSENHIQKTAFCYHQRLKAAASYG